MKKVHLLAEGPSDARFFKEVLAARWPTVEVSSAQGRGSVVKQAQCHVSYARSQHAAAALLVDQDDDKCAPKVAQLIYKRIPYARKDADVMVAVACREREAWILADCEALMAVYQQSNRNDWPTCKDTAEIDQPKKRLKKIERQFGSVRVSRQPEHLAGSFNISRAAKRSKSFARFVKQMDHLCAL